MLLDQLFTWAIIILDADRMWIKSVLFTNQGAAWNWMSLPSSQGWAKQNGGTHWQLVPIHGRQ